MAANGIASMATLVLRRSRPKNLIESSCSTLSDYTNRRPPVQFIRWDRGLAKLP
jgi:hypothetical protein